MSFKIPCGGFKLDEKSFSLDENGVLSIPKPLTYDYMPEGYPSKSIEYVTLMEEQEVMFSEQNGLMGANSPVDLEIKLGDKLTVVWDGVSYDVIVKDLQGTILFGNLAIVAPSLEATDSPFAYGNQFWFTTDTATTHTIKVMGQQVTYAPMDANFIPVATENTYGAVKTSDFIKVVTLEGKVNKETVYKYAKEFEDGKIRLRLVDNRYIYDISSIGNYGVTEAGEIFTVYTEGAPYCGKQLRQTNLALIFTGISLLINPICIFSILGIIFGIIQLTNNDDNKTEKGWTIFSIILSILITLLWIYILRNKFWLIMCLLFF